MTGNDDFRMPEWDNHPREPDIFGEADEAVAGITEEAIEERLRQIHRRADGYLGPAAMPEGSGTGQAPAPGQVGEDIWLDDGISDEDYWASVATERPLTGTDSLDDGRGRRNDSRGADHPDSRDRGQAGDAAGAVAAYEKLLDDEQWILGPDYPYTPTIGGNLAYWRVQVRSASQGGPITSRERDIARLIAQGLTNKAIAAELAISPATVARHVANLMTKLNFRSRAQIAFWVADTSHTARGE